MLKFSPVNLHFPRISLLQLKSFYKYNETRKNDGRKRSMIQIFDSMKYDEIRRIKRKKGIDSIHIDDARFMHVTFLATKTKKKSWTEIWRGGNVRSHKAGLLVDLQ